MNRLYLFPAVLGSFCLPLAVQGIDTYESAYVAQALVHAIMPHPRRHDVPIVMLPGANLASYIYLETPDGRAGWAQRFARDGYDVYVVNDPKLDFSRGFNVAPFTVPTEGAPPADPEAERAWQRDVWKRWGFGDPEGIPYSDTRFPTDHFGTFETNYPYVSGDRRSYSDAVIALLERVGPAIIMAHSAGASTAVNVGTDRPELVAGFIMIEPAGPPEADDFPALAGKSMLGVYGDYISSRNQTGRKTMTEEAAALFRQHGGAGNVISLPEDYGIHGNTHLMMQDDNSLFIADLIIDWLGDNVDTRTEPARVSIYHEGESLRLSSTFRGIWESSTNLVLGEWIPLSTTSSYETVVIPGGSPQFFRQVH